MYHYRCSSFVGRIGDEIQHINMGSLCSYIAVVHEIGHAVGFWHEHGRPDRDKYITIHRENILPGFEHLFEIEPETDSLGEPYDFNSVMHYYTDHFSVGDSITITSKEKGIPLGRGPGLSPLDIKQTNLLYKDQCSYVYNNWLNIHSSCVCILWYYIGLRSSSESRLPPKPLAPSPVNLSLWNCSEHLIGKGGQFFPPDNPYKNNTDCVWAIEVPEGHGIQLKVYGVDLE